MKKRPDRAELFRLPLPIVMAWLGRRIVTLQEGVRCQRFAARCGLKLIAAPTRR